MERGALAVGLLVVIVLILVFARRRRARGQNFDACGPNARIWPSGGPVPMITPTDGASFERTLRSAGEPPYTGTPPSITLRPTVAAE